MMKQLEARASKAAIRLGAMTALCAVAASPVAAAPITWESPVAISPVGDAIVRTDGDLVQAINFNSSNTARTVNGVTFTAQTTAPSGWTTPVNNNGFYTDGGVGGDFASILDSFTFGDTPASPSSSETLTLTGLTSGNSYLVQFFVSDDRTLNGLGLRTQNFTGGGNTSATVANNFSYSLIGMFTADAATQAITITGFPGSGAQTTGNPILNAFQVRQIPEPATLLLMGVSFLVMLATTPYWRSKSKN